MTLFAFIGVVVTSATAIIYGSTIWDPVVLAGKFESKMLVSFAMIAVAISTLATNIAANIVSPANDFSNLAPKKINFRKGGYIQDYWCFNISMEVDCRSNRIYFHMVDCLFEFAGPVGGIMIADYYFIRKQTIKCRRSIQS